MIPGIGDLSAQTSGDSDSRFRSSRAVIGFYRSRSGEAPMVQRKRGWRYEYRAGIGRTSIIQEISAAAPLRISHDVFNGESATAAALINVWYLRERCLPVTFNEQLPIRPKMARSRERDSRGNRKWPGVVRFARRKEQRFIRIKSAQSDKSPIMRRAPLSRVE